jgi:hypothetical protein
MSAERSLQPLYLTDDNGNPVGVILDGSVYRLQSLGKILNASGTQIDPATEGKQDDTITKLTSIDGKDFATQTTLAAADTKLGTIDGVLDSIKDTDGVKKITDALPVGDNTIGRAKITDGTNVMDVLDDSGVYRGRVEAKIASGGANQKAVLVDGVNTVELAVVDGALLPANTRGITFAGIDDEGKTQFIALEADGKLKSTSVPPTPPANTIETVYAQEESDLEVVTPSGNPHNTDFIIPTGKTFYLQFFSGGSEGDPSEKGSKFELFYIDSSSVSHIVTRQYLYGQSLSGTFPDTAKARDGTTMVGNGSTTKMRIRRERLSNATGEIDVEVRGYLKDT